MSALNQQVMLQRMGEAMVVLNADSGQYYELNDSAADMLELWLQHRCDRKLVVDELARRYASTKAELSADLATLLQELAAAGIISGEA